MLGSDGSVYFTAPIWHTDLKPPEPVDPPGAIRKPVFHADPDGVVTVIDDGLFLPNGIALSPDGRFLYVTSSDSPENEGKGYLERYPVNDDGIVGPGSKFVDLQAGGADGLTRDCASNIYVTLVKPRTPAPGTAAQIEVYSSNPEALGTLRFMPPVGDPIGKPLRPSNSAFGGPNATTLYGSVSAL